MWHYIGEGACCTTTCLYWVIFLSLGVDDRKLKFMKTDFDVANKSLHWKHRLQTLNTRVATNVPCKTVTLIYNKIWAQQSPGHFSKIGLSLPTTHSTNPDCMVIKTKRSKRKQNCTSRCCAKHLFFYWSPIMQFDLCQNQWMAVRVGYKYGALLLYYAHPSLSVYGGKIFCSKSFIFHWDTIQ